MFSNGACHLGNDVFVGGMADVDDSLFTLLGGDCEELPLGIAVEWHYGREWPGEKTGAAGSAAVADACTSRCHSKHASPNGRFVLALSSVDKQHYLVDTRGGAVTIFETREAVRSVCWHPRRASVCLLLLASGDVDVYNVAAPIRGALLRRIGTIPALRLIHGLHGQATRGGLGGATPSPAPSSGGKAYSSPLLRKTSNGNIIRAVSKSSANAASPSPLPSSKGKKGTAAAETAVAGGGLSHSQLCVLNATNSTAVEALVCMCFMPPCAGQPLLLAVAATNGDVYVIKIGEASCAAEALSSDRLTSAKKGKKDTTDAEKNDENSDDDEDSDEEGTPVGSPALLLKAFEEEASPYGGAAAPYVRLLVSSPSGAAALSEGALPRAPVALNAFLVDVRGGRSALAALHEDGVLRTYYLRPSDLITAATAGPAAAAVPARTAADSETIICDGLIVPSEARLSSAVVAQQCGNALLYRIGDELFLVAMPMWLRRQQVWAVRYAEGGPNGSPHRDGAGVLPLSSEAAVVPSPLAVRVPVEVVASSVAIGVNDILLLPALIADGTDPIIVKIEHILETAMMAMHRKGVRMLNGTAAASEASPNAAAGSKRAGSAIVAAPAAPSPPSTSSAVIALKKFVESVAVGCAAFYADFAYESEDGGEVAALIDASEACLRDVHRLLEASELTNSRASGDLRAVLAAAEGRQAAVIADYQRMLDIATAQSAHRHGVQSLLEVNKMLGELHTRLGQLEAAHCGDAAMTERAVAAIRAVNSAAGAADASSEDEESSSSSSSSDGSSSSDSDSTESDE